MEKDYNETSLIVGHKTWVLWHLLHIIMKWYYLRSWCVCVYLCVVCTHPEDIHQGSDTQRLRICIMEVVVLGSGLVNSWSGNPHVSTLLRWLRVHTTSSQFSWPVSSCVEQKPRESMWLPVRVEEIESPTYSPLLFWPNCTFRPLVLERLAFMEEMTCENSIR